MGRRRNRLVISSFFRKISGRRPSGYVCGDSFQKIIMERADKRLERERSFTNHLFTIEDLARLVGTNRTYLSQSIKMQKGMSFCSYINGWRIGYAKRYIEEKRKERSGGRIGRESGQLTTDDLAIICGFGSKRNFIRQFKQRESVTPMQYIRKMEVSRFDG